MSGMNVKECVFAGMAMALLPCTAIMVSEYNSVRSSSQFPQLQEKVQNLSLGLIIALVLCATRHVLEGQYRKLAKFVLSEKKRSEDRIERFGAVVFKLQYFIIITTVGYIHMKDEEWFPAVLGGSGATIKCYDQSSDISPSSNLYYMTQLGYHLHSLLYVVFYSNKRNDFMEMFVHHCCAVFSMMGSYTFNQVRIGSLVLFVHDIGDVFGYLIKSVVDTDNTPLVLSAYIALLISWGYTRLYVYPMHIAWSGTFEATGNDTVIGAISCMLWILQGLHVYWYSLFLVMGYRFATKGKAEDIQQKCHDDHARQPLGSKKQK